MLGGIAIEWRFRWQNMADVGLNRFDSSGSIDAAPMRASLPASL